MLNYANSTHAHRKLGFFPELVRSIGTPYIMTECKGYLRTSFSSLPFPGLATMIHCFSGKIYVISWDAAALHSFGINWTDQFKWLLNLPKRQKENLWKNHCMHVVLDVDMSAWIHFGHDYAMISISRCHCNVIRKMTHITVEQ